LLLSHQVHGVVYDRGQFLPEFGYSELQKCQIFLPFFILFPIFISCFLLFLGIFFDALFFHFDMFFTKQMSDKGVVVDIQSFAVVAILELILIDMLIIVPANQLPL